MAAETYIEHRWNTALDVPEVAFTLDQIQDERFNLAAQARAVLHTFQRNPDLLKLPMKVRAGQPYARLGLSREMLEDDGIPLNSYLRNILRERPLQVWVSGS